MSDTAAIPWRNYFAAAVAVLTVLAGVVFIYELRRVVAWLVVAAFFAVVLAPAVDLVERRLHVRRGLAVAIVVTLTALVVAGLITLIVAPLVTRATDFASNFSQYVNEARAGQGPLGGIVRRYNLDQWIDEHQQEIQDAANSLGANSLRLLQTVGNVLLAVLTIFVLTILMLLQGPNLVRSMLNLVVPKHRERVRRAGAECARAMSGYVAGNVIISVIAGAASYVCLRVAGVPFPEVLALWVGFADLIPLVGATIGAAPAVIVAFLHSVPAGIAVLAFFIIYQQFENHVLQVTIMSRTVALNPLAVLVSVLVGVELFGFLGALLAIPAGGAVQIVTREIWAYRKGDPEPDVAVDPAGLPAGPAPP